MKKINLIITFLLASGAIYGLLLPAMFSAAATELVIGAFAIIIIHLNISYKFYKYVK